MDEAIIAPDAEVIASTEPTVEQPEKEVEQTISEMSETVEDKRVVDEHVFVAEKKARKAAEKELKSLKDSIENGATRQEISDSISEIADEHNIDKGFLQKLASSIKAETERELDAKYSSRFEAKDKESKFETAFKSQYEIAMERAPEFKSIANSEVIKTLAIQPQNAKKTLSQILEDTYGNAITGKRTIETSTPNGGKDPEPLDYHRAEKDIEYFKEVMKDPKKKAQYNARMIRSNS